MCIRDSFYFFDNDVDDYDYYLDNDICTYNHFYFFDDDGDDYDYYLDIHNFYFFDRAVHYANFGNLSTYYRADNFYNFPNEDYCHFVNNA